MFQRRVIFSTVCLLLLAGAAHRFSAQVMATGPDDAKSDRSLSMTTPEHLRNSVWWPTKPATAPSVYAGTETCARCHAGIAHSQAHAEMARTLVPAAQAQTLLDHLGQGYRVGDFQYSTKRSGKDVETVVTGNGDQRRASLEWAFGSGEVAQSYLWAATDGTYRESRFNFFADLGKFGATPGRLKGEPTNIDMALGRVVDPSEAVTCFSCHTTAMFSTTSLRADTLRPGVSCEACHGPGAEHVKLMQAGTREAAKSDLKILNPADFAPDTAVDFCGACHSTGWDTKLSGSAGPVTVRFPAYRLEKSRCWGAHGDPRLTCFSCHNPHAPLERQAAAYDANCLSCHVQKNSIGAHGQNPDSQHPGRACPVSTTRCVSCHMPKIEVPDMHHKFTDHMIRIARAGDAFPD